MTDHLTGNEWASIFEGEEDELMLAPPDSATMNADLVSHQLRTIRALQRRLAEYDLLHNAELERLMARRRDAIGGAVQQIARLEAACEQYARKMFEDTGRTTLQTPNGVLRVGRARVDELHVNDVAVNDWLRPLYPSAVIDKPKVLVDQLRIALDTYTHEAGVFVKAIRWSQGEEAHIRRLEPGEPVPEWQDHWEGVYLDTSKGGDGTGRLADFDRVLPGVEWKPQGRKVSVVAA